jgi:hypothetical protein
MAGSLNGTKTAMKNVSIAVLYNNNDGFACILSL